MLSYVFNSFSSLLLRFNCSCKLLVLFTVLHFTTKSEGGSSYVLFLNLILCSYDYNMYVEGSLPGNLCFSYLKLGTMFAT